MKNELKEFLRPIVPPLVVSQLKAMRSRAEFKDWNENGRLSPPPHIVKQRTIAEYQQKYRHTVLVETGTYMGDMIEAQKKRFKKIVSIELADDLFFKARKRFKTNKHIIVVHGDSGKVLPQVLENLNEPAIFWLDGHYSAGVTARGEKECPIFEELEAILARKQARDILLIDDARCFVGNGDYPSIQELSEKIRSKNEQYRIEVRDDIIRCLI